MQNDCTLLVSLRPADDGVGRFHRKVSNEFARVSMPWVKEMFNFARPWRLFPQCQWPWELGLSLRPRQLCSPWGNAVQVCFSQRVSRRNWPKLCSIFIQRSIRRPPEVTFKVHTISGCSGSYFSVEVRGRKVMYVGMFLRL